MADDQSAVHEEVRWLRASVGGDIFRFSDGAMLCT